MQFEKDNKVGYRLITYSSSTVARLKETISIQYQDEAKTMSEEEFIDRVTETARSIINGEYSAWIDNWEDDDVLHIEPDYGFGSIDIVIDGIEV